MIQFIRNLIDPPRIHNPSGEVDSEPGKTGINPIHWLQAKNKSEHLRSMILDPDGYRTVVEDSYAQEGERDGWLIYDSIYTDVHNEKFLVYIHR